MATTIQAIHLFKNDPVLFVEKMLGANPEPWQREVLQAIPTNLKISIKSGHGVGKTALISWIVWWYLCTHFPAIIICAAPTRTQIDTALWREARKWGEKLPKELREQFEATGDKIYLKESPARSVCRVRTANKDSPEALAGAHEENTLLLLDEASGIPEIVYENSEGSLSTKGARIILTGNPTRASGYFYDTHHKDAHMWKRYTVSQYQSSLCDPDHIEYMKNKYGENSNRFRVRSLGEFPLSDDDSVLSRDDVLRATLNEDRPAETAPVVWGLDVARYGSDRSALCKRQGNAVLEDIQTWRNKSGDQLANLIIDEYIKTPASKRPEMVYVDAIGVGASAYDFLKRSEVPVRAVNVSERASAYDKYANQRAELWFRVQEWFESRTVNIPNQEELVEELVSVTYKYTKTDKLLIEAKDEMRKRLGFSPDLADAFVLTFVHRSTVRSKSSFGGKLKLKRNYL